MNKTVEKNTQKETTREEQLAQANKTIEILSNLVHDMVVGQQAAWIEWKHGQGAEEAMNWIENALAGPGQIPSEDEPWSKEAQAYFDANKSSPFPACFCGRPSNHLWMGMGFCSTAHYDQQRTKVNAEEKAKGESEGGSP